MPKKETEKSDNSILEYKDFNNFKYRFQMIFGVKNLQQKKKICWNEDYKPFITFGSWEPLLIVENPMLEMGMGR